MVSPSLGLRAFGPWSSGSTVVHDIGKSHDVSGKVRGKEAWEKLILSGLRKPWVPVITRMNGGSHRGKGRAVEHERLKISLVHCPNTRRGVLVLTLTFYWFLLLDSLRKSF